MPSTRFRHRTRLGPRIRFPRRNRDHPQDRRGPAPGFTARSRLALLVLSAAVALDIGSVAIVNPALPDIGRDLAIGPELLQWTLTAYGIGFAGFLLMGGRLADVASRRLVLGAGVGLFCVGAVAAAGATMPAVLTAGRALQGVGAAVSVPAALALVFQVFPPGETRHRALAVYTAVGAAGFGTGLVVGGVVTSAWGWRATLVVSAAAGALVLAGVAAVLPASAGRRQRLDLPAAALGVVALAAVVVAISELSGSGPRAIVVPLAAAVAVTAAIGFVAHERHADDPLITTRIVRPASVRAAAAGAAVFFFAMNGVLFLVPLYTQGVLGYTPLQSGLAVLPMAVVVSVVSQLSGRALSRIGARGLLVAGLIVLAVGVALWLRTGSHSGFVTGVLPPVVVMAVGQGLAYPALTAASLAELAPSEHGVAGAVNVTAQQIGAGLGVAIVVLVSATVSGADPARRLAGYHASYLVVVAVLLVGASAVIMLFGRRGRESGRP